jgi:hypothetical protein
LATQECGDLVRGGFFRKGNTEEQPSFLAGVMLKQVGENLLGGPRLDVLRAVGAGKLGEARKEEF